MKIRVLVAGASILALSAFPAVAHKSARHHHHHRHHHHRPLEEKFFPIADELALSRAIVETCYKSDGANLNRTYWDQQLDQIPKRERYSFNRRVDRGTKEIEQGIPADKQALWCDDQLDALAKKYKTTLNPPLDNGPASHPVCWSDPSGMYGCQGIGYDNPLAGVNEIIRDVPDMDE
jgi:hypothetical protein